MAKQLRGIVIRVRDLDAAVARYEALFGVAGEPVPEECFAVPDVAGVRFAIGESFVQLVGPNSAESPLQAALDKRGEGLSQIALWVDDLDAEVELFRSEGVEFTEEEPRSLPMGRVIFVHPASLNGVVWELEEHPEAF